jgi:hypothetical protein
MRLALKAQSQCRATLETLVNIKNPRPVAFVQQANIANGPQRVNNMAVHARVENAEIRKDKLLEGPHGERLDTRAASPTIAANQDVAAVEK